MLQVTQKFDEISCHTRAVTDVFVDACKAFGTTGVAHKKQHAHKQNIMQIQHTFLNLSEATAL